MKTKFLLLGFCISCLSLSAQQISRGSLGAGSAVPSSNGHKSSVTQNNVRLLVVDKSSTTVPADEKIILSSVYPNPASDKVVVDVATAEDGKVQFKFFTATGALVSESAWSQVEKGGHAITLDISKLSADVYMVSAYFRDEHGNIKASGTSKLTKF